MTVKHRANSIKFYKHFLFLAALAMSVSACNTVKPKEIDKTEISEVKLMELGQKAESRGDTDAAIAFYRQANVGFPNAIEPVRALAQTYYRIGAYRNAALSYARLGELASPEKMAAARLQEGRSWLKARNPGKAALAFETALTHDVTMYEAMSGLGVAQDLMGRGDDARKNYLRALEQSPENRQARNNLALSHLFSDQLDQALPLLRQLVEDHPNQENYRLNLAMALYLSGDQDGSRRELGHVAQGELLENNIAAFAKLPEMTAKQRAQFIFNSQLLGR